MIRGLCTILDYIAFTHWPLGDSRKILEIKRLHVIFACNIWCIFSVIILQRCLGTPNNSVLVLARCYQATSHKLSHCWLRSMSPNGIPRGDNFIWWGLNNMVNMHFHDWKYAYFINISLKFLHKNSFDNNSVLIQVMAWQQTGIKVMTWTNDVLVHWYNAGSLRHSMLTHRGCITHIYASVNFIIIGLYNGLPPVCHPAITGTNAELLSIGFSGTKFNKTPSKIQKNWFKKINLSIPSAEC